MVQEKQELDLEDGEIEDDDDDNQQEQPEQQVQDSPPEQQQPPPPLEQKEKKEKVDKEDKNRERGRPEKRKHEEKGKRHMTEAEKSILHLRKREEAQRKKWEKMNRTREVPDPLEDDFAKHIEKTLATILNKKEKEAAVSSSDDRDKEKSDRERGDEEKRGRKRKKFEKDRKNKQRRFESPISDTEMLDNPEENFEGTMISDESIDSVGSPERNNRLDERKKRREKKMNRRNRDRGYKDKKRDKKDLPTPESGVCVFYLQGKCVKTDCPYSHETTPPMKLELCKFYLMSCCAKGDNCSYMHSDFPCKFYHTGLHCNAGDDCKFAHGEPLSDTLKQILFKHIETAPREILGGFPRVSRDEALIMIESTQSKLQAQMDGGNKEDTSAPPSIFNVNFAVPPPGYNGMENNVRVKQSRWQDLDDTLIHPFSFVKDQDMRINSNGDIDMRTLAPPPLGAVPPVLNIQQSKKQDVDIRTTIKDIDIRQISNFEPPEDKTEEDSLPKDLPKMQRDLFMRIQANQKSASTENEAGDDNVDINWYSDDDDDDENRLTIRDDNEDKNEQHEETSKTMSPPRITQDVMQKIGDLSKIDISDEVTKLLTSISQQRVPKDNAASPNNSPSQSPPRSGPSDPRTARQDPRISQDNRDPRLSSAPKQRSRQSSSDSQHKPERTSIYEQGSIEESDIDLRSVRPDIDLRNLQLPFKGMQNYTPASEIDASLNSHDPISWKLCLVEIPRPDYAGLKLSKADAQKSGDPRLRKIFRLSTEERDTPLSPSASPKASASTRVDPRLKKLEESKPDPLSSVMNFGQQVNALQSSPFYQSLTSNQKLMLNQELSRLRNESGNSNDPTLNGILSNLNLIPNTNLQATNSVAALSILAKLNPILNQPQPHLNQNPSLLLNQPGLLGAAPGIPNMTSDFFDPRNNGLLGTAPPIQPFANYQDNQNNFNFNDDFYPETGNNFQNRDNNRGFNRDRRRGRHFNHRNGNNRNFRRNNNRQQHRNHSPS